MPRVRHENDCVAEVFPLHDLLAEREVFACRSRAVFDIDPVLGDPFFHQFLIHALRLGNLLIRAFTAGHDAWAFGVCGKIFVRGLDPLSEKRARMVIDDQTAKHHHDRRTLGFGCFSMGKRDHHDACGDDICDDEDGEENGAVLHDLREPRSLPVLDDRRVDPVIKMRVCQDEKRQEKPGKRADIPAVSADYFRREKH